MSYPFDPDYVVHPGATLRDLIVEHENPAMFLVISGFIGKDTLTGVLSGKAEITPEIAEGLAKGTGISAAFWLAYEHNFRVGLAAGKHWSDAP